MSLSSRIKMDDLFQLNIFPKIHPHVDHIVHRMRFELTFFVVLACIWLVTSVISRRAAEAQAFSNAMKVEAKVTASRPRRPAHKAPPASSRLSLGVFYSGVEAGRDLASITPAESEHMLMNLFVALIRINAIEEIQPLVSHLRSRGIIIGAPLCTSVVKLCTSKRLFQEALDLYDVMAHQIPEESFDKSVWSCLLYCSAEINLSRGEPFFERLSATPEGRTSKDCWNMMRILAASGNWQRMLRLMQDMKKWNTQPDNVIYNTALTTCVTAGEIEVARQLMEEMNGIGGMNDVITYNIMMKGYAKNGNLVECFKMFELMKQRNVVPTQVTFGILLDGCINARHVEQAMQVFDMMVSAKCPMNTVLYTTLIKGFARVGKVNDAMRIFHQMEQETTVSPDLITFSILLKAHCDVSRLDVAFSLLEKMVTLGLTPDEVIFNNLLVGCANELNYSLAERIYHDMVKSGIRPSNATFSILIRMYSDCKRFEAAIEMLKAEPIKFNVEVEPRLYCQLIHTLLRGRSGRRACEVYALFTEHHTPCLVATSGLIGVCLKLNMFDTVVELLALTAERCGDIYDRDFEAIREGLLKKKPALVEACDSAWKKIRARRNS